MQDDKELLNIPVIYFETENSIFEEIKMREIKPHIGTLLKQYKGDEDLSYHGSSWFDDITEILGDDNKIYKHHRCLKELHDVDYIPLSRVEEIKDNMINHLNQEIIDKIEQVQRIKNTINKNFQLVNDVIEMQRKESQDMSSENNTIKFQ